MRTFARAVARSGAVGLLLACIHAAIGGDWLMAWMFGSLAVVWASEIDWNQS